MSEGRGLSEQTLIPRAKRPANLFVPNLALTDNTKSRRFVVISLVELPCLGKAVILWGGRSSNNRVRSWRGQDAFSELAATRHSRYAVAGCKRDSETQRRDLQDVHF